MNQLEIRKNEACIQDLITAKKLHKAKGQRVAEMECQWRIMSARRMNKRLEMEG